MNRRLATILIMDAVGYSRLMGRDEAGTLAALKDCRTSLIDPKAAQYRGRTIKLMGDGALMEFASVVDAVQFAVEVQCALREKNADVAEDVRLEFRIGVNVGDVIAEEGDIHGDGVNVAARLEALAPVGGICIRRNVRNQIRDKLDIDLEDLGEVEVKNIERPVRVFNVLLNAKAEALRTPVVAENAKGSSERRLVVSAVVALCILVIAGLVWWQGVKPGTEPLQAVEMDRSLPEKPSIAVLAFSDLSQGPDKGYLSDAISEETISKLSRFPEFFVVARNSSFFYRDKSADIRDIAQELGVRYVLEGSQQKSGDRLRVTAQLIDAAAGNAIWVETYDRDMIDVFALQDEITRTIVATLEQNIDETEYDRLLSQSTENFGAYELVYRSRAERMKWTAEGHEEARRLAERALELDPDYSVAYFSLAWVHLNCHRWGWCADRPRDQSLDLTFAMAEKAVALDPDSSLAHWVLANAIMQTGELERADAEFSKAINLNPNSAGVLANSADVLVFLGRAEDAIERIQLAIRLNPHHPDWYLWTLAWAQYFAGDYEAGLASINQMAKMPNLVRRTQAALLVRLGRIEEAREAIDEFLESQPDYTISSQRVTLKKFRNQETADRFLDDLRQAGLPEGTSE